MTKYSKPDENLHDNLRLDAEKNDLLDGLDLSGDAVCDYQDILAGLDALDDATPADSSPADTKPTPSEAFKADLLAQLSTTADEYDAIATGALAPKPSQSAEPSKKHPVAALLKVNKLNRKRRKSAARSKTYRDRKRTIDVQKALDALDAIPLPPIGRAAREAYDKRLAALINATLAPNARQSLVQIRGREEEITLAWQAKASFGGIKVSVAKIAKSYPGKTEWQMRNLLKTVRKLEQLGGPWHGMQQG